MECTCAQSFKRQDKPVGSQIVHPFRFHVHKGYGVYRLATHCQPTELNGYAEAILLGGDCQRLYPHCAGGENMIQYQRKLEKGES